MINFIKPDMFATIMAAGATMMGIECDVDAYTSELMEIMNLPSQTKRISNLYGDLIPSRVGVFTMNNDSAAQLNRKYGLNAQEMAAAVIPKLDSRYNIVMFIGEEYVEERSIILHELVHVEQVLSGKLVMGDSNMQWCDGGVTVCMGHQDNISAIHAAKGDAEKLVLHELSKPWELEAYAKTLPDDNLYSLPDSCTNIINLYRKDHGITVS